MSEIVIADLQQRELARDPARSVIVQAPAGSGKTELLMQRYLALLEHVDEPEEILAVTFTRKAAAEMRHRILLALGGGNSDNDPRLPETAALADKVLKRDAERGWKIMEYPGRLRIRTLDSVNNWLTSSAPVSGDGTALGTVTEQTDELYELAARQTLELVTDESELGRPVNTLLVHLDNRTDQFVRLMAQMLKRRDQWLPLLGSGEFKGNVREQLERSLHELVAHELEQAAACLSDAVRAELNQLLLYAATQLANTKPDNPICVWLDREDFPPADPEALVYWRAIAEFCLVKSSTNGPALRKSLTKANGFPTVKDGGDAEMKQRAIELLANFAGDETVAEKLDQLRVLPAPAYSDEQWEALDALIRVLPMVAAQLMVIFRERGETDYIQMASEALAALRDEDGPTGLALRLDYRVSHILIDEFQDTSRTQFRLLQNLIDGWTQDDGRSLFVVGDPMQSIYRFRQAEVALYLELWERGIGQLKLEQVQLTSNFRSDPEIVDWVNHTFAQLMPAENDPATGAVRFAPGTAVRAGVAGAGVQMHCYEHPGRVDEADDIAALVEQTLVNSPDETIGILVRTRHQARLLVPRLRERGISFAGAGLELAGETAVEQDLIALTRALVHQGDRTAWLALLRAPCCGLSLLDLEQLCGQDIKVAVFEQMQSTTLLAHLSADGQSRVRHLCSRLESIYERQGSLSLRDWIEGAWQQLDGPASLSEARDLELAQQFFGTLDEYDDSGNIAEAFLLHERLANRADSEVDDVRVHLLTLFRAKGLEYDTVILPALDGITRQDDKSALAWHESTGKQGETRYLMAPIENTGGDADPLHALIRQFEKQQADHERDRLLYVAATRAKKNLHVYFELKRNKQTDEISKPRKGSLLERLWPVIADSYSEFHGEAGTEETREKWIQPRIRRFPAEWTSPELPLGLAFEPTASAGREAREVTFEWAGSDAMRVGSVVHRCLQYLAEQCQTEWSDKLTVRRMLLEEGVSEGDLSEAEDRVLSSLARMLADDQGRWILLDHPESLCEHPVTVNKNGRPERLIIDRSFVVDDERWIIDYKTSAHEGGNLEGFIDSEVERYSEQLNGYRMAMQLLEPDRTIRTALYFPLLAVFRELEADASGAPSDDQIEPAS